MLAELLAEVVSDQGGTVIGPAARVASALRLVSQNEIDGAFLDVTLGGEDSFPVAEELAGREVPFIFLTGYSDELVFPPRFRHIARLAKPFDVEEIVRSASVAFPPRL